MNTGSEFETARIYRKANSCISLMTAIRVWILNGMTVKIMPLLKFYPVLSYEHHTVTRLFCWLRKFKNERLANYEI
jgi:hypothetical protein